MRVRILALLLLAGPLAARDPGATGFRLPGFPMPKLAADDVGTPRRFGLLRFMRELYAGGVANETVSDLNLLDDDYAVIDRSSLPGLAGWLEATCQAVDFNLPGARSGHYDGTVLGRLLQTGASLAAVRENTQLAMPIGIIICTRAKPWGSLPGDGRRDAYALIATEQGLQVYDPPSRQLAPLADFPNVPTIATIQF